MPKNQFETAFQNKQRTKELRKLNEALRHRSDDEILNYTPASTKLAEAILRAQKSE